MAVFPHWAYPPEKTFVATRAATETSDYGRRALEVECGRVTSAAPHTANDSLNRAAFAIAQLVAGGEIGEAEARSALVEAAHLRQIPEGELQATLRSGFESGLREPRKAPETRSTIATSPSGIAKSGSTANSVPVTVAASPFKWRPSEDIPARKWLYGRHLLRRFASATVAPSGVGKSLLLVSESLAMVTGRDILGVKPDGSQNVWLWNLEDSAEEIERQIAAAVQHYGIDPKDFEGRLFVNSGRDTPLVIARQTRDGIVVQPVIDALSAEIKNRGIDVLVIDPFVSCHDVPENDNSAQDRVIKAWARVAEQGNCAVELVHHTRKLNGEKATAESVRGGSAFTAGCRDVRLLSRMEDAEGARFGVEHFRFFSENSAKQNFAAPAETRKWYRLVPTMLGNGDDVAVVTAWRPADLAADVSVQDIAKIAAQLSSGSYRQSDQAAEWAGCAVARILGLDVGLGLPARNRSPTQNRDRAKAKAVLQTMLANGTIAISEKPDAKRTLRSFYVAPPT